MTAKAKMADGASLSEATGATWFLRCAACEELYVARASFDFSTGGKEICYWARPRPIRKPKPCTHQGGVERWDGTAWVAIAKRGAAAMAEEGIVYVP